MRVIYEFIEGAWRKVGEPAGSPDRSNFVIVCQFGDWSGFRTLAACLAQIPSAWERRAAGFYWIEER